jgi:Fe2+ transport system protein FeoA
MTLFGLNEIWNEKFLRREKFFDRSKNMTGVTNLAEISPGRRAKIQNFSANVSPDRQAHLFAYGLLPGRSVQVLQHRPVTVVRIEHFELAMERELAAEIKVEKEEL